MDQQLRTRDANARQDREAYEAEISRLVRACGCWVILSS
jgi:hypothetical protein